MSTQYLDKTGLAYFWEKLKDYFQVKLVSGTNIKTINNQSILGSGNISISGGGGAETDPIFSASAAAGISSSDISSWNAKLDTETDPTVPAWAKAASKPTYTASEVGALPDSTSIPSKTSDLTNDSGFVSIVASGTSNGWTYRKWSDGTLEMWGEWVNTSKTSTSDGGGYISVNATTPPDFPIAFIAKPMVNVSIDCGGQIVVPINMTRPTATSAGSWKGYRVSTNNGTANKYFMFHCIGRWKA